MGRDRQKKYSRGRKEPRNEKNEERGVQWWCLCNSACITE
jgi:hypothetical protein